METVIVMYTLIFPHGSVVIYVTRLIPSSATAYSYLHWKNVRMERVVEWDRRTESSLCPSPPALIPPSPATHTRTAPSLNMDTTMKSSREIL